jgi:C-terminal processing protease CtpA/Prc
MVKQVARKSEAAAAGLKAFDVILKVGADAVTTLSDWDRALRSNQGKPVQVTILRDRKQQTLTLQVDSKHKQGELEFEEVFPASDGAVVAEIDPEFVQQFAWNDEAAAEALRDQADAMQLKISPEQVEALRRQAEVLRESLKGEDFQIDQKQLDQLKQQMEEFRKSFKPEDFKLDPKQMDELRQQMEQLQRQMEEIKALGFGSHV